jgi:hypothetical protein
MCLAGASRAGADLLAALPDADLRAHFVWVPMLLSDTEEAANTASKRFAEPRASHYWDLERHLSSFLASALAIDTRPTAAPGDDAPFAWDIYLAYRRENTDIETPDFWMHQLAVDHAPHFDAAERHRHIQAMIDKGA